MGTRPTSCDLGRQCAYIGGPVACSKCPYWKEQEEGVTASPSALATPKTDSAGTAEEAVEAPVVGGWQDTRNKDVDGPHEGLKYLIANDYGDYLVAECGPHGNEWYLFGSPYGNSIEPWGKYPYFIPVQWASGNRPSGVAQEPPHVNEVEQSGNRGGGESLPVLPHDWPVSVCVEQGEQPVVLTTRVMEGKAEKIIRVRLTPDDALALSVVLQSNADKAQGGQQ